MPVVAASRRKASANDFRRHWFDIRRIPVPQMDLPPRHFHRLLRDAPMATSRTALQLFRSGAEYRVRWRPHASCRQVNSRAYKIKRNLRAMDLISSAFVRQLTAQQDHHPTSAGVERRLPRNPPAQHTVLCQLPRRAVGQQRSVRARPAVEVQRHWCCTPNITTAFMY